MNLFEFVVYHILCKLVANIHYFCKGLLEMDDCSGRGRNKVKVARSSEPLHLHFTMCRLLWQTFSKHNTCKMKDHVKLLWLEVILYPHLTHMTETKQLRHGVPMLIS